MSLDILQYQLQNLSVFTPKSQGITNEFWTKSMDARYEVADNRVDIFARANRQRTAEMLYRHLRWLGGPDDNLVSWTSSLLFALVYIFHLYANTRDGSNFDNIHLCVVDTSIFPEPVFLRDMDLIQAYRSADYEISYRYQDPKMDCDLGDAADANSPPRDNGSATNSEFLLHVKVFALAEKDAIQVVIEISGEECSEWL
ncbi:hypothetical protein FNAPI_3590 [Fusarium napiforme]|uniref:Uncharacterized protein n=1 Tax=Fusarium napiforme TaxID=42672 RepID=A0A8H5JVU1_9HYPO|nr:hypothetical protein FNAPI_3590 [Fusarium napiforme]